MRMRPYLQVPEVKLFITGGTWVGRFLPQTTYLNCTSWTAVELWQPQISRFFFLLAWAFTSNDPQAEKAPRCSWRQAYLCDLRFRSRSEVSMSCIFSD